MQKCIEKLLTAVLLSLGPACWLWDYLRRSGQVRRLREKKAAALCVMCVLQWDYEALK